MQGMTKVANDLRPGAFKEAKGDLIWEPPLINHGIPQICFTIPLGMGEMADNKIVFSLNNPTCSFT